MRRDDRRLQYVELVRKVTDRLKQLKRILNERREHPDGNHISRKTRQVLIAECEDHKCDPKSADEIDKGIEDRIVIDRLDIGFAIIVVYLVKSLPGLRFSIHQLHRLGPREVFLEKGVQLRVSRPDPVKPAARMLPKPVGAGKEDRNSDQGDDGEFPVEPEHHPDDRKDNDEIAENINDA